MPETPATEGAEFAEIVLKPYSLIQACSIANKVPCREGDIDNRRRSSLPCLL